MKLGDMSFRQFKAFCRNMSGSSSCEGCPIYNEDNETAPCIWYIDSIEWGDMMDIEVDMEN